MTRLRCEVSEAKLDEDLLAFGIAYRRAGMPRIMTLVAEQAINASQATGWWQGGGNSADLRVVENAFMDRMEKSGFTFIDPEVLSGKVTLETIGADPNVQKAREIGRLAGAEVVVVGRAIAKPLGEMAIDNGTFYSSVANVSARAVRTDTGEVIAATEFTGPAGKGFEQTTAGRGALSAAGPPAGRRPLRQDRQGLDPRAVGDEAGQPGGEGGRRLRPPHRLQGGAGQLGARGSRTCSSARWRTGAPSWR